MSEICSLIPLKWGFSFFESDLKDEKQIKDAGLWQPIYQ